MGLGAPQRLHHRDPAQRLDADVEHQGVPIGRDDVIGPAPEALAAVNGAHLRLLYVRFPVSSQSQAGKIVQQTPLGGGTAPQNAQVVVFLAAYRG